MMRLALSIAALALGAALLAFAAVREAAAGKAPEGGTFRISFAPPEQLDHVDPALSNTQAGWSVLDTTCAPLMAYPDKPAPAAFRIVPEVAAGYPAVSRDGKTYTFTLKSGFRFSDGSPVRASAFARAINRALAPEMKSPGAHYMQEIAGARDVRAGKATAAAGVVARGNRLVIRLTQPVADFPVRTTMPSFCAVPPTLPADPEGVRAFPAAGPYYVAEYRPGQRVLLQRNRFYGGRRPHHVDGFDVDLGAASAQEMIARIERGEADWGIGPPPIFFLPELRLAAKYGVNRAQFFVKPGFTFRGFVLNTSRPLFRDNPKLRQAVNFAVDRAALGRASGGDLAGRLTDQYLPPSIPGFKDARIYPLDGPDLAKARSLARGNTRDGKAVLYTYDFAVSLAGAQILSRNLAEIGLDVEVRGIPVPAYPARVSARDEPYDIAFLVTPSVDYIDPYTFLNIFLDGRFIGSTNWAKFDSPKYNRLLRAAARLRGDERARAYGELDVQLARDAAPIIATSYVSEPTLVSNRVGCVILRPALDLTAVCVQ